MMPFSTLSTWSCAWSATGVAMPVNLAGTDKQRGVELFADARADSAASPRIYRE